MHNDSAAPQMDSPKWRSFASHEMAEIGTDLDLTTHPTQDGSTNRLLNRNDQGNDIVENHRTSAHFLQSHASVSSAYSDATETPMDARHSPAEPRMSGTYKAQETPTPNYWNGNLFYALTWEVLGIVVSICFLSTLTIQLIMLDHV
jgi:hypothetical protein